MGRMVNVNIKMDENVKKNMEAVCSEMGLTMSAAFNIFAKKVGRERRIPFEVSADPFYSESNMRFLDARFRKIKEGKAKFEEHDLLEDD